MRGFWNPLTGLMGDGYGNPFDQGDSRLIQNALAKTPQRFCGSIDDWLKIKGHAVSFDLNGPAGEPRIQCDLQGKHNGNYVSSDGYAETSADAFLNAVEQIEKTIGTGWRSK